MQLTIFGCGYSGRAIAGAFRSAGARVSGTARTADKAAALGEYGIDPLVFDGIGFTDDMLDVLKATTHIVQSIPPTRMKAAPSPVAQTAEGDPLLALVQGRLATLCPKLEWIGYLSTVGVYGDHGGGWVTEETPGSPILGRSIERVDTENGWSAEASVAGVPVAHLRLSGIYGPGRNAFVNLTRGSARRIVKPGQVFNRIRVEDIGGACLFLAEKGLGGIYNVTDDEPCPPQDVIVEAARLMALSPPPEQDFETAEMTPMARSFYGANKRVSNAKLKRAGYTMRFPDYRVSLAQLWEKGVWKD